MILQCPECQWKGTDVDARRASSVPACPRCGFVFRGGHAAASVQVAVSELLPAGRMQLAERPRSAGSIELEQALALVIRSGYAVAPVASAELATRPAPPPVAETFEFATIISQRGQVRVSGAGVGGHMERPAADGVAAFLNALGAQGYRCVSSIMTGDSAIWTLERPKQGKGQPLVRSALEPVVKNPATGADLGPPPAPRRGGDRER